MPAYNDQIVRLYDTVFDRAPDLQGLAYWNKAADDGYPMMNIVNLFITAPEFAQTYGAPGTNDFVRKMYANVLDREPDDDGLRFWSGAVDSGKASRADVVWRFSESREHVEKLAAPARPDDTTSLPETQPGPYRLAADGAPIPKDQYASADRQVLVGGDGPDQLFALGRKDVTLWGQGGNDRITGWEDEDVLHGGAGDDLLLGQDGKDRLFGGPGRDTLIGGADKDTLTGGAGNDVFQFGRSDDSDVITDFQRGDVLRFVGEGFALRSVSSGKDVGLTLDLAHRQGSSTVEFVGLSLADEGWVRDAIIFG